MGLLTPKHPVDFPDIDFNERHLLTGSAAMKEMQWDMEGLSFKYSMA